MFWTFDYKGQKHVSWGKPWALPEEEVSNLMNDSSVKIYSGEDIAPEDSVLFMIEGDSHMGLGDSIWIISFIQDFFKVKCRNRGKLTIATSQRIQNIFKQFLPKTITYTDPYIEKPLFDSYTHKVASVFFKKELQMIDKSWLDNKSVIQRTYDWAGIKYDGLADFAEFTPSSILYPNDSFYKKLGITKEDKYVFFQWRSSGVTKNLPPKINLLLINHIIQHYKLKVYVIDNENYPKGLENIEGVIDLSGKTDPFDLFSLAFNSELIVCPDSAGLHLSEAYRVPCVCLMSTLPPVCVASKYKIPTFMFGEGRCKHKPCGILNELPKADLCPAGTNDYCFVFNEIDLLLFDNCVAKTISNRLDYRSTKNMHSKIIYSKNGDSN